jgi:hypothetical protein
VDQCSGMTPEGSGPPGAPVPDRRSPPSEDFQAAFGAAVAQKPAAASSLSLTSRLSGIGRRRVVARPRRREAD